MWDDGCRAFFAAGGQFPRNEFNVIVIFLMTTPTKTEISGLVSLITEAARTVESYYQSNGENVPSIDNTEPHPLDNTPYPPDVRLAVQTIEGACLQLCASVARPGHTILNVRHPTLKMILGCVHSYPHQRFLSVSRSTFGTTYVQGPVDPTSLLSCNTPRRLALHCSPKLRTCFWMSPLECRSQKLASIQEWSNAN